jgi:hypothetical protein
MAQSEQKEQGKTVAGADTVISAIDGYERWIMSEERKEQYRRNWEDGE